MSLFAGSVKRQMTNVTIRLTNVINIQAAPLTGIQILELMLNCWSKSRGRSCRQQQPSLLILSFVRCWSVVRYAVPSVLFALCNAEYQHWVDTQDKVLVWALGHVFVRLQRVPVRRNIATYKRSRVPRYTSACAYVHAGTHVCLCAHVCMSVCALGLLRDVQPIHGVT